jgi:glycosyltransferase involved in cell wall biosynthesis
VRFLNAYEPVTSLFRDLPVELARAGLAVEVVLSGAEYRTPQSDLDEWLERNGVRVVRIPAGISAADTRIKKLWTLATYAVGAMAYALLGPRSDVNIFLTQPPLFFSFGVVLRALRAQRFACVVMDLYPDVAIASGSIADRGVTARLLFRFSRWSLRRADTVFVIGRCMFERLARDGVPKSRLCLVSNWADESAVEARPRTGNPYRMELQLGDAFVVLYSGNMGVAHTFDELIGVATNLARNSHIRFVLIGDGARRKAIDAEIRHRGLRNVIQLPFQPRERLADAQALGDIHLITQRPGMEGIVVPSKAYSAMAAGRPIVYVGAAEGEIARTIIEHRIGTVVPPGDPEKLHLAIMAYVGDAGRVEREGRRAREVARTIHSRAASLETYKKRISELVCTA